MTKIYFTFTIFFFLEIICRGQNPHGSSKLPNKDRILLDSLYSKSLSFSSTNIDSLIYYFEYYNKEIQRTSYSELKINVLGELASWYSIKGDFAKLVKTSFSQLDIAKLAKDHSLISKAYSSLANSYNILEKTEKKYAAYDSAVYEARLSNNKNTLFEVYKSGKSYFFSDGKYRENLRILNEMSLLNPNVNSDPYYLFDFGNVYRILDKLDSATFFYQKAIKLAEQNKDTLCLLQLYINYGLIPRKIKKFDEAIEFYEKGIGLAQKINFESYVYWGKGQLLDAYFEQGNFPKAKLLQEELIKYNEQTGATEIGLIGQYEMLSSINSSLNQFQDAYLALFKAYTLRNKVFSQEEQNKLSRVEEDYLEKEKQLQIDIINKEKEAETRVKNIVLISLIISIFLIMLIIFFFIKLSKSRKIIFLQKEQVEKQKHLIEEKQKEIIDSITYARRIQRSLLPTEKYIDKTLRRITDKKPSS